MPWIHQVNSHYLKVTGRLDRAYFTAPFSLAVNVRGYENLVNDVRFEVAKKESFEEFLRAKGERID